MDWLMVWAVSILLPKYVSNPLLPATPTVTTLGHVNISPLPVSAFGSPPISALQSNQTNTQNHVPSWLEHFFNSFSLLWVKGHIHCSELDRLQCWSRKETGPSRQNKLYLGGTCTGCNKKSLRAEHFQRHQRVPCKEEEALKDPARQGGWGLWATVLTHRVLRA